MDWQTLLEEDGIHGFRFTGLVQGSTAVLEDPTSGLVLLMHVRRHGQALAPTNDREYWRDRPPFAVVYEDEYPDGVMNHHRLIETADLRQVGALRELVYSCARDAAAASANGRTVIPLAWYRRLQRQLHALSATPQPAALRGFLAAVSVCADLMALDDAPLGG